MRYLALVASLAVILPVSGAFATEKEKEEKITVRSVAFKPKDPTSFFRLGGQGKVTALTDAESVEKLVGKDNAKMLVDAVDFTKEQLVFISWTTSGPPDGKLMHEVKGMGKDRKVIFYVQGPEKGKIRGQRARLGADFFALPKNVTVEFEPKERAAGAPQKGPEINN
jgi:hypothetical protein